jgi:hypothetical protein
LMIKNGLKNIFEGCSVVASWRVRHFSTMADPCIYYALQLLLKRNRIGQVEFNEVLTDN